MWMLIEESWDPMLAQCWSALLLLQHLESHFMNMIYTHRKTTPIYVLNLFYNHSLLDITQHLVKFMSLLPWLAALEASVDSIISQSLTLCYISNISKGA